MKYAAYDPMTDSIDVIGSLQIVIPALCSDTGLELIAVDNEGPRDLRPDEEQAAKIALAAYAEATGASRDSLSAEKISLNDLLDLLRVNHTGKQDSGSPWRRH